MARLKRKSISIIAKLRNYFFTGIVVLVPIGITLYLTKFFISISPKLIPSNINPNNYMPFSIPGLEIVLSVIFITLIGGLSLSFIGRKFLQIFNDLLKKIPILRTIYSAIGQMAEFLAPKRGKKKPGTIQSQQRLGMLVQKVGKADPPDYTKVSASLRSAKQRGPVKRLLAQDETARVQAPVDVSIFTKGGNSFENSEKAIRKRAKNHY